MKLIIDIPDREYKQRLEFPLCYDSTIDKAITNGTPLSKELEKVRAKLEELANDEWNIQVCATKGLKCAIEVIDDYISELKGENNGNS